MHPITPLPNFTDPTSEHPADPSNVVPEGLEGFQYFGELDFEEDYWEQTWLCPKAVMPPFDLFDTETTNPLHAKHLLRGSVGIQPRGSQFSLLPSSFHDVWITQDKLPSVCSPSQRLSSPFTTGSLFPPELQFDDGSISRAQFTTSSDDKRKMKVLVPISPKEYLEKLNGVEHPCQLNFCAWGWYSNALEIMTEKTPEEYLRFQARVLNSIISRAKELASEERKRKLGCDEVVKKINVRKRLCLFRELLRSINHPDKEIVDDLEKGFCLTGWLRPSNLFPKLFSPPADLYGNFGIFGTKSECCSYSQVREK